MAKVMKGHCEPGKGETAEGEARAHSKSFLKKAVAKAGRKKSRK